MVFNATFNNNSVTGISWWSVLLLEETIENHRPVVIRYSGIDFVTSHRLQLTVDSLTLVLHELKLIACLSKMQFSLETDFGQPTNNLYAS
jgi:hypothetical protein